MTLTETKADAERIAVIYCRVSNSKQRTEHDGLRSQETRCREYARYRECEVVAVFEDDMSGGKVSRPGMDAMSRTVIGRFGLPKATALRNAKALAAFSCEMNHSPVLSPKDWKALLHGASRHRSN